MLKVCLSLVLAVLLCASLVGCKKAPEPSAKPAEKPAPESTVDEQDKDQAALEETATAAAPDVAAETAQPELEPSDTAEPAPDAETTDAAPEAESRFANTDGSIEVLVPPGEGWECVEQSGEQDGAVAMLVKCRSTLPERFFFFMAKDYSVPPESVVDAKTLFQTVFLVNYTRMFSAVAVAKEGERRLVNQDGYEAELILTHESKGAIRKLEWLTTIDNHVILLSAEGEPETFELQRDFIAKWFDAVRFSLLQPAP
ncbi:MAG: hypothetical protein RBU37_24800 [Myxococcota bacterium]|jgi:hypothetical protein|nr:hypothetical protein [Myxococcota bacterium]